MSNIIYCFLEGVNDIIFFEQVLVPYIQEKYNIYLHPVPYEECKKAFVKDYINSIKKTSKWLFFADFDSNGKDSITYKKQCEKKHWKISDIDRIIIVKEEIEGWYLAGYNKEINKELKLDIKADLNNAKENYFLQLIPKKYTESEFRMILCEFFSIEDALNNNKSFKYFINFFDTFINSK